MIHNDIHRKRVNYNRDNGINLQENLIKFNICVFDSCFEDDDKNEDNDVVHKLDLFLAERTQRRSVAALFSEQ